VNLEAFELVLLRRTRQYEHFDDENRERIFREHLRHTMDMVASGRQLAAGPVSDSPAETELLCGLGLFQQGSLDAVRQLMDDDPGVRQGLYSFDVMTWRSPAGTMLFPAGPPQPS